MQARLKVPNDSSIDYDLLLYSSSYSLIKYSDYVSLTTETERPLDESLGYIATSNETVNLCVYATTSGSSTEPFTLDIAISDQNLDSMEPNDNMREAIDLDLNYIGRTVYRNINSPLDTDWYKFNVKDEESYDHIRFMLTHTNNYNDCIIDLYQDVLTDSTNLAPYKLGSGANDEIHLDPGDYYACVRSNPTSLETYNTENAIIDYTLTVEPAAPFTNIKITSLDGPHGCEVNYPEGRLLRIDETEDPYITIKGKAYYVKYGKVEYGAFNARLNIKIEDTAWTNINRPDMAWTYATKKVDSTGNFEIKVKLKPALGGSSFNNDMSMHYYDLMKITIEDSYDGSPRATSQFYYLHLTSYTHNP